MVCHENLNLVVLSWFTVELGGGFSRRLACDGAGGGGVGGGAPGRGSGRASVPSPSSPERCYPVAPARGQEQGPPMGFLQVQSGVSRKMP